MTRLSINASNRLKPENELKECWRTGTPKYENTEGNDDLVSRTFQFSEKKRNEMRMKMIMLSQS